MRNQVLIVDESVSFRLTVVDSLESINVRAVECDGLVSAERALRAESFEAMILSDSTLDGNALEFMREIRVYAKYESMKIIVVSNQCDMLSRLNALKEGADEFVSRRSDVRYLVKRIRFVMGEHTLNGSVMDSGPYRILIGDDSPTYLEAISLQLGQNGHDTVTAPSGSEAIRYLGRQKVDAIVLDVFMPGMNGVATCRVIKSWPHFAHVPVILLTGQNASVAKLEQKLPADELVLKSTVLRVLDTRIRELIVRMHAAQRVRTAARTPPDRPAARPAPVRDDAVSISTDRLKRPDATTTVATPNVAGVKPRR